MWIGLNNISQGMIVRARKMGDSIPEIVMATVTRVYTRNM